MVSNSFTEIPDCQGYPYGVTNRWVTVAAERLPLSGQFDSILFFFNSRNLRN